MDKCRTCTEPIMLTRYDFWIHTATGSLYCGPGQDVAAP